MALWLVQFTKSPDLTKYSLEAFFPTKTSDVYLDYNYGTYFSGYKMCLPVQRWHRICHTFTHSDNGTQQRYTKLHDTIPISLFVYESIEQRYRDGVMHSFVYFCCVMTPSLFLIGASSHPYSYLPLILKK